MVAQTQTITWIPVSERLPGRTDFFLIHYFVAQEKIEKVRTGRFYQLRRSFAAHNGTTFLNVIAWAELPKGYKP